MVTIYGEENCTPFKFSARKSCGGGELTFWCGMVTISRGWPSHRTSQAKPIALLCETVSGAERAKTYWGVGVAEITPNFYFMKRFPCEEGGGTTIIFHTLRGQGTITLTSPIKKQKVNKKKLAAHFFGQRFWAKHRDSYASRIRLTFRIYPTKTVLHVASHTQVGGALPQAFDCPSTEEHLLRLRAQSPTYCTLKSISSLSSLTKVHG